MSDRARVTVLVRVEPSAAFEIFTREIDQWWRRSPGDRNRGSIHFECSLGGRLLEASDNSSGAVLTEVGRITAWEPPRRFVFEWRAPNFEAHESTEVEVTFVEAASGTTVTVEHRGLLRLRRDHPFRHGYDDAQLLRFMGLRWGAVIGSYREHAERR